MRDILDQGGDREHGPWPRRLAVTAALLLAAVLIAVYLPGHLGGRPHSSGAATRTPSAPGGVTGTQAPGVPGIPAGITGITGSTLPWGSSVALPVSGEQPVWLWPASGRTKPIGGLPEAGFGYQFTRAGGGWAVQANPGSSTACGYCDATPLPVYFLRDRARSATQAGLANLVAPGTATGELWLTSYPRGTDITDGPATAQEVSATGVPLGPRLTLPAGQVIERATDRGLLLGPASPRPGVTTDTLWNPAHPQDSRTFAGVIAASAAEIAWAPGCGQATAPTCRVRVLDLVTGKLTTVALPGASSAASGAFSPDGQFLAIEASFYDSGSLATQLDVATVATGHLSAVPGTSVSSDALVGFGWPTSSDSLVAELSFTTTVQVASWDPGAAAVAVVAIRPGPDSTSLVVG
jgi:hypothetical protein